MEYFELGDLYQHVKSSITELDAKIITKQLLEGLAVMHEHGFTHRDLKPQVRATFCRLACLHSIDCWKNIFVAARSPWWVKIGDFGITKRIESAQTALRTVAGTQHFQALEILGFVEGSDESSEYTSSVDIWSLGCVTYNLLTQKVPFADWKALGRFAKRRCAESHG